VLKRHPQKLQKGLFKMALVTSKNKAEHDEEFMNKRAGQSEESKPQFKYPHYNIGDIVKMSTGHMKVTEHQNDKNAQMYHGVDVNEYGEESSPRIGRGAMHSKVGTGHHYLYAKAGEYPTRPKNEEKSGDSQFDRVKNHPKYERLKAALGKKGATDALLKELNDEQGS